MNIWFTYEIWACAKKRGGFLMMKSDRAKSAELSGVGVCVGVWTIPGAPYSGHVDHAGCHCGWWMWVGGQVGRAWPRAQALTVTRSDTPSPPALTATSGRRHSSKYGRRHYSNYNQNLCSSEVKRCDSCQLPRGVRLPSSSRAMGGWGGPVYNQKLSQHLKLLFSPPGLEIN